MTLPKLSRVAFVVDDMDAYLQEMADLLDTDFLSPPNADSYPAITVKIGENGLEPIQLHEPVPFAADGRFIEAALEVESAEATKAAFESAGFQPVVTSYLDGPDTNEYLFGRDFFNLPLMICTKGDNEIHMRQLGPYKELDDADTPKLGTVTLVVESIDQAVAGFQQVLGMEFIETDPAGLGTRAVVGPHRLKLVEGMSNLSGEFELPLASIDVMVDDVEATRSKFEAAGYSVKYTRELKTGGKAYYFGSVSQRIPFSIYPVSADTEILGQA